MTTAEMLPTPPPTPPLHHRSLRTRWRSYMILGLNVLVVVVVSIATLVTALEQRQALLRLHETGAAHVHAQVAQTVQDAQRALRTAATQLESGSSPEDVLPPLLSAQPAFEALIEVGTDGKTRTSVPTGTASNWAEHPAFLAAHEGRPYAHVEGAVLFLAVPMSHGDALLAQTDAATLLASAVTSPLGRDGYAYLAADDGTLLATAPTLSPSANFDPAALAIFEHARAGQTEMRLYHGMEGGWVLGQASADPALGFTVITETPLSEFTPMLVRVIGLWGLALILTAGVGEWLIRRILRTVVGPLEMLRRSTHAVSAGDYGVRVRVPPNADRELMELSEAFNMMVSQLAESQRQLDAYANELQEIVDRRARELARKAAQMEVAAEVTRRLATIHKPQKLVETVVGVLQERFEVYHVEVWLADEDNGLLVCCAPSAEDAEPLSLHTATSTVIGWVAASGQRFYVPDVTEEPRYRPSPHAPASRCQLAIPLRFEGTVLGVLNLEADHRNAFERDRIEVLEALADEIAVALHNAQAFSALERANNELAQTTLQANQANTLKSRFLYNMSQRLRTPLEEITNRTEAILSGLHGEVPQPIREQEEHILESGRVTQALVEDMLDLSALESGYLQLNLAWVELPPLLDEVTNAARALHMARYPDHDLDVRLDLMHLTEPLPPVWADLDRLRYILINLMDNAVKYTEAGEVVMTAEATDEHVLIHVRDTGPGVSEEQRRYLFEPFQHARADTAPEGVSGTGLGLPVSRLLAMRHGGDLLVETAVGKGSTFTLRLPRRPSGAPPPP